MAKIKRVSNAAKKARHARCWANSQEKKKRNLAKEEAKKGRKKKSQEEK